MSKAYRFVMLKENEYPESNVITQSNHTPALVCDPTNKLLACMVTWILISSSEGSGSLFLARLDNCLTNL